MDGFVAILAGSLQTRLDKVKNSEEISDLLAESLTTGRERKTYLASENTCDNYLMPTVKQKMALKEIVENRGSLSGAMRAVGYTIATAKNPKNLTQSKGWQDLLGSIIDDETLIGRTYEIALQEDKRASLQAIDMLLKLKDRYPTNKLKISQYDSEVSEVLE